MGGRLQAIGNKSKTPGPAAYLPGFLKSKPGGITFGMRTDKSPYITAEDHMPCIE